MWMITLRMHGTMRGVHYPGDEEGDDFLGNHKPLETASVQGVRVRPGDRVRIKPKNRADESERMLEGKIGMIEAIEQDAEEKIHLAVVIEDDPGRELGIMRQPGHQFFLRVDDRNWKRQGNR